MDEPELNFTSWVRWRERGRLITDEPTMAVYLWARFENPPPPVKPNPEHLPQELIYVGETNELNARLLRDGRHQRLVVYRAAFPDDSNCERLFVSVAKVAPFRPQEQECHALRAFTRSAEARIGWEYAKRFGRRPRLDFKQNKDEFVWEGIEWREWCERCGA
jgi:hypothetical protein